MISGAAGETTTIPFVIDAAPSKEWLRLNEHDLEFDIRALTGGQFTLSGTTSAECPRMPAYADSYRLAYFTKAPYPIPIEKPAVWCDTIADHHRITTATTVPAPPTTTTTSGNSGNS
jgi:hypothetical protein